jgi:hypothetical protein
VIDQQSMCSDNPGNQELTAGDARFVLHDVPPK